jgi:chromosome segregation ATPase
MEKTITQQDLNEFVFKIQQYFIQYEKLNAINEQFAQELQDLLEKSDEAKEDIKEFLVECISMMNTNLTKQSLKQLQVEVLIQKYYDPQKLQMWLDTAHLNNDKILYPPDAPTSVKLLTSQIKKLQKEFESVYQDNYRELKELIASLKTAIANLDQEQIEKTNSELDKLYSDSRQADMINLNITLVDERMNTVCRNINSGN